MRQSAWDHGGIALREGLAMHESTTNHRLDRSVDPDLDHVLGPTHASLTLLEYGSYACPYCRAANMAVAREHGLAVADPPTQARAQANGVHVTPSFFIMLWRPRVSLGEPRACPLATQL